MTDFEAVDDSLKYEILELITDDDRIWCIMQICEHNVSMDSWLLQTLQLQALNDIKKSTI